MPDRPAAAGAMQDVSVPTGLVRRPREIVVVIPCYRVADQILPLLAAIGPEVARIDLRRRCLSGP